MGLWCGEDDAFVGGTRAVADALPTRPEVMSSSRGATRVFWNDHTLAAFDWLAAPL